MVIPIMLSINHSIAQ